jgi:hypothetical protein
MLRPAESLFMSLSMFYGALHWALKCPALRLCRSSLHSSFIIHHSSIINYQSSIIPLPLCLAFCLALATPAWAMDHVTFRRNSKTIEVTGRPLAEVKEGLLLLARDGVIWAIKPEEQIERTDDGEPFKPYSRDEIAKRLLKELPQGFRTHSTTHYLICYNTSPAYAQWCGSLFEQLYTAFTTFWTRKGLELRQPEFPLVAIVFGDKRSYLEFTRPDLGAAGESIIGYFGLTTNRMTMYDLTGAGSLGRGSGRGRTAAQINQVLAQPDAARTVATIIHEATHQIAFNCGLHTRLSDCPVWFSEGIAEYFETPNVQSGKGWKGIGKDAINTARLEQLEKYLPARPANSLETLLRDDARFLDPKQSLNAYAEAWALTYFLIRQHPKQYVAYLAVLSKKKPHVQDDAETRINEFRRAFGELGAVDTEFLRYIGRVR